MDWYLGNPWYLLLIVLLPIVLFLLLHFLKWQKKKRAIFAETKFQSELFEEKSSFAKIFPLLYILGFLFLIFSIVDVLNGSEEIETKQKMNNVLFLMDVSNSMNAEDIAPNRLTEAKNLMIQTMAKMNNDKIGIVIFAGQAQSIMPLTTDFSSAETYIEGIETNAIQIQGTDFLKAIQTSVEKFKNVSKGSRKIILISDGEDNEGNDAAAIKLANKEGISITSVGVGTEEGGPVPEYIYGQLMGYKTDREGQTVITKRQVDALKKLSESTGSEYIDGNNINEAPSKIISAINKKSSSTSETVKSKNANHYYQYFLAISIFLFLIIYLFNPKRDFSV